jgi:hypothetical protein
MQEQILAVLNNFLCPVTVRFGRTSKITETFVGNLLYCTWSATGRKGGGFVFHIEYGGMCESHHVVLPIMLADYTRCIEAYIEKGAKLKPVKNCVLNPTKDLQILLPGCKPQQLGSILPTRIRELTDRNECWAWINFIRTRRYLPVYTPNISGSFKSHVPPRQVKVAFFAKGVIRHVCLPTKFTLNDFKYDLGYLDRLPYTGN